MSASKHIANYPGSFLELAMKFINDTQPINICLPTQKAAITMRFKLYDFKNAVRAEKMDEMYANFLATVLTCKNGVLTIAMPENDMMNSAILDALSGKHTPSDPLATDRDKFNVAGLDMEAVGRPGAAVGYDATYQTPGAPASGSPLAPAATEETSATEESVEQFLKKD